MKRTFLLLMTILMTVCFSSTALAVETPPADQVSDTPFRDSGFWTNRLRTEEFDISYTSYGIEKNSSTSVFVSGTTRTNQTATRVSVLVTVQQWKNNKWNNYDSIDAHVYGGTECSRSDTVSVDSGYYYRVKVTHNAFGDTDSKTKYSYSKSVLVN